MFALRCQIHSADKVFLISLCQRCVFLAQLPESIKAVKKPLSHGTTETEKLLRDCVIPYVLPELDPLARLDVGSGRNH